MLKHIKSKYIKYNYNDHDQYKCFKFDNKSNTYITDPDLKNIFQPQLLKKIITDEDLKEFQKASSGGTCMMYVLPKIVYDNPFLNLDKTQVDKLINDTGLSYTKLINITDIFVQNGMSEFLNNAFINDNFSSLMGGIYEEQ